MNTASIAAFVSYALAALLSMAFGIIYLVRSQFMPYHQEALDKPWQQLDARLQALLLGLMRTAGGGLLAGGISATILLLIPFRAGESWSLLAIPAIGLVTVLPTLYATVLIRSRTQAHTPVAASAIGVGLIVIGFIFSLF
jgi:hypothetical protein